MSRERSKEAMSRERSTVTRIRIVIAFCAAITVLGALATMSTAADKKLYAKMDGKQEKPPGDVNGVGTAVITVINTRKVCYDIRPKKAGRRFTFGHIHTGAKKKVGGVLITLWRSPKTVKRGKLSGCSTAKATFIAKLKKKPAGFYVNIHNSLYTTGAIRGQLTATVPKS